SSPRRPPPLRIIDGGLYIRERATGEVLRHCKRIRHPFPSRDDYGSEPPRAPGAGQCPDGHFVFDSDVSDCTREVLADEHSGHPPAASTAERAGAEGKRRKRRAAKLCACADGGPPEKSRLRLLPCTDGSARVRTRQFHSYRKVANN